MARRRHRRRRGVLLVLVLALVAGGYAAADAADVVPGVLTTEPPIPEPAPFPEAAEVSSSTHLPELDPDLPAPDPAQLEEISAELVRDHRSGGDVGVVVRDALTAEVLTDLGGQQARTPASSLKLLTAVAALDALGPARVLPTRAVAGDGDEVVLVGGGDILLTAEEPATTEVVGRASLQDLAHQTAAALEAEGTTEVRVALDDTLFDGPLYAPGWGGIDYDYVMPIQPLALNSGLRSSGGYEDDPALAAARAFAGALEDQGIDVTGEVTRAAADDGAAELGVVESAPVRDVVGHMLSVSDNSVAEVLARLVAVADGEEATFAGASRAVEDRLAGLGIDTAQVTLADSSGLLIENQASAAVLAEVVALALDPDRPDLRGVVADLPVAALQGTLSGRMHGPAAGVLRAKTGTLITAVSLTGVVQNSSGRLLVFSVVADEVSLGGVGPARAAIDEWAAALATT